MAVAAQSFSEFSPVLFVSHSQAEVRRLAQWVMMIERGRVRARNHLTGRIRQIVRVPQSAFAAISQIIWEEATAHAVTEMQLKLGAEIVCLLKAHNLAAVE